MFFTGSFGKNLDILWKTMDASMLRNNVMSNNIANSDTPNFKRTDVNFEAQLKRALDSEKGKSSEFPAFLTDEKHIPFYEPLDYSDVKPKRVLDYLTTSKNNGNNVDIETETMGMLQNQLMYQTLSQAVAVKFANVQSVLRG
jgi:flagellar basal-body rod protein FlgB